MLQNSTDGIEKIIGEFDGVSVVRDFGTDGGLS